MVTAVTVTERYCVFYTMDFGLPEGVTLNTDGTYNVVAGTKLTVEAAPYQHNYFSGWTGTTETAATFTVTVSEAMTLTANFAASPVLTLQTNDATMGTVGFDFTPYDTELTVCDGTITNSVIPAHPYNFDNLTKAQHIIPASMLGAVAGSSISSLKYYNPWEDLSAVSVSRTSCLRLPSPTRPNCPGHHATR